MTVADIEPLAVTVPVRQLIYELRERGIEASQEGGCLVLDDNIVPLLRGARRAARARRANRVKQRRAFQKVASQAVAVRQA